MKCDDYQLFIHDFLENELDKENQKLLFSHLSECENCGNYLTTAVSVSRVINEDKDFFPASLEEQIFNNLPKEKTSIFENFLTVKLPAYFAYALVAIVLLLSFTLLSEVNKYKDELHQTSVQLKEQKRTVELLFNTLPTVEVHPVLHNNL